MALPTRVNRGGTALDPLDLLSRDFEGVFNRWLGGRDTTGGQPLAPYGVDIREDADHFYVEAELPGFKKEEVEITLENQTLTIAAERKAETKRNNSANGQDGELLLHERRYTRFLRSFTLPPVVDEQSVNARLNDGVLTITLNKREETKPRRINVG
jgi:HSP20 family protein